MVLVGSHTGAAQNIGILVEYARLGTSFKLFLASVISSVQGSSFVKGTNLSPTVTPLGYRTDRGIRNRH
jgi:hypothetical protein